MKFDDEKYKALMYDIQRTSNKKEIHKLILEYAAGDSDNIRCIKNVIMEDSNDREFTKDKTYQCYTRGSEIYATNDSQSPHGLGDFKFFSEHFEFI